MKRQKENTATPEAVEVEVVFASPERQEIRTVSVPANTTARSAVEHCALDREFPEYDFQTLDLGIYGKLVPDNHLLRDGDRVEIYRPLQQLPTQARRIRAKSATKSR